MGIELDKLQLVVLNHELARLITHNLQAEIVAANDAIAQKHNRKVLILTQIRNQVTTALKDK